MNTLAERLGYSRKEVGLSQTDVAKSLKVSASAVNQWEQGLSKNIKLDHFFGLAQLLHQDPQWLATETVYPQKHHTRNTARSPTAFPKQKGISPAAPNIFACYPINSKNIWCSSSKV